MRMLIVFAIVALLGACQRDEKPEDLLSHEKMISALKDIYLLEVRVNDLQQGEDSTRQIFLYLEKKALESHNIADSTFLRSFNYYTEHPDELDMIYARLLDTLNLLNERSRTTR